LFKKIASVKTNLLTTVFVASLSAVITLYVSNWISQDEHAPMISNLAIQQPKINGKNLLDCNDGTYSPVQRRCVDQDVFDAEMKRLFLALGLDTTAYEQSK